MNFRLTGALFGLVFVSVLVLLGISLTEEDTKAGGGILDTFEKAAVKPDHIDTVEIEKADGGKMKFVRTDGKWYFEEPVKTRADDGQVTRIIEDLFKARPIQFAELSSSKATHGLDPAGLSVTLRQGSERAVTVNVGDVLGGGRSAVAFVTTSDRPERPMAINREGVDGLLRDAKGSGNAKDLAKWVNDYRTRQVFSVNPQLSTEEVGGISLVSPQNSLNLTRAADGWHMTARFQQTVNGKAEPRSLDNVDADPTGDLTAGPNTFNGVRPLLGALTSLQAISGEDFLPDDPAKLVEYGLADGNPERVTVEIKLAAKGQPERTETAFIGKKVENAPNKLYVRVPGIPGVIRAQATNADAIRGVLADPTPLRNRNLFPSEATGRTQISAVDITKDGKTSRLRQPANAFGLKWQLFGEAGDPTDANGLAVTKIIDVLTLPRTVKDFPAPNDANFAGPELKAEVKVWTEMETPDLKADPKAEPKTKGNPITFQFGKVTRDAAGKVTEVYVRRILANGTRADFVLPGEVKTGGGAAANPHSQFPSPPTAGTETDVLATVSKSRLELLDPKLKDFATTNVAKLAIANGPTTTEATFDEKSEPPYFPAGKWTYTKFPTATPDKKDPPRPADEGETRSILTALANLSAGPFKLEKRDDTQWTAWGLNPASPRMKVTVSLKAAPPQVPVPGQPAPPAPAAPEERTYYFGNDVAQDGKTYVFARQEGRDAVFLIDKAVFDRLDKLDLRDRTVVRFDVNKAKKVTVAGWFEKNKYVSMLVFEKKADGTWGTATVPPGTKIADADVTAPTINVDPNKIPPFIGAINMMHADVFLSSVQKAEYGFKPTEKGLVVVIEVEGAPTVSLNIGSGVTLNPDKTIASYVAPEQATHFVVFVDTAADPSVNPIIVSAAPYKPFKETPGVFGK